MKAFVKKILPVAAINTLRDAREKKGLAKIGNKTFKTHNLITNDNLPLNNILNDQELEKRWETDKQDIAKIFEHQDKYGGVNPGDRRAIYTIITGLKPQNVLEVGTHIGASTLYIARALKGSDRASSLTTVDIVNVNAPDAPWKKIGLPQSPVQMLRALDCAENVIFEKASSLEYLKNTDQKFDFIFLDGDHSAATVYEETALALDALTPGGIIMLHDYYPNGKALFPDNNIITGPYRALERIKSENPDIQVLPLGALPWETKQGSHNTSLAMVTKK